ncbi:hypothetical protein Sjap_023838 [Stephania japonica]|uniref:Uncharacterized protein n=1 Tax=Stephania japonica TaxID=461633 RepID=A0AAP0HNC8_9MAGN
MFGDCCRNIIFSQFRVPELVCEVSSLEKGMADEMHTSVKCVIRSIFQSRVHTLQIFRAFLVSYITNKILQHYHTHQQSQGNIQSLTAAELDNYGAHAWLLSPPCQPYTRQGLQKDSNDARASSFLKILDLIPQMSRPPLVLFVENVVGFETSDTHNQMMQIFAETGFVTQEFILSPLQFGVPYSRPRYFCLAKRIPLSFQNPHFNHHLLYAPGPLLGCDDRTWTQELYQPHEKWEDWIHSCEPISKFLEFGTAFPKSDNEQSYLTQYKVPQSLIERWGSVMDIVYPDSRRCCCFTKSYYRYVKGTGSLLTTIQHPSSVTFQAESNGSKASSLKEKGLRYFTPREVANLHSFPESFQFPEHISLRQRYALLGNSLSAAVVGPLLHYLFTETSLQTAG